MKTGNGYIGKMLLVFSCSLCAGAELSVPHFFSDNMVLQQGKAVKIWGKATPAQDVSVQFRSASGTGQAAKDGTWELRIETGKTGREAHRLVIRSGEENNIHPKDKQTPGERLARWALARDYGRDIVYSGPLYRSHTAAEDAIIIRFSSVGNGLKSRAGKALQRFEISGTDRKWVWAQAEIVGTNQVRLSCPDVPEPVAARYAWASNPAGANLVNSEGLPASVFTTEEK